MNSDLYRNFTNSMMLARCLPSRIPTQRKYLVKNDHQSASFFLASRLRKFVSCIQIGVALRAIVGAAHHRVFFFVLGVKILTKRLLRLIFFMY